MPARKQRPTPPPEADASDAPTDDDSDYAADDDSEYATDDDSEYATDDSDDMSSEEDAATAATAMAVGAAGHALDEVRGRMQRLRAGMEALQVERLADADFLRSSPFRGYRFAVKPVAADRLRALGVPLPDGTVTLATLSDALRAYATRQGLLDADTGLVRLDAALAEALEFGPDADTPVTPVALLARLRRVSLR